MVSSFGHSRSSLLGIPSLCNTPGGWYCLESRCLARTRFSSCKPPLVPQSLGVANRASMLGIDGQAAARSRHVFHVYTGPYTKGYTPNAMSVCDRRHINLYSFLISTHAHDAPCITVYRRDEMTTTMSEALSSIAVHGILDHSCSACGPEPQRAGALKRQEALTAMDILQLFVRRVGPSRGWKLYRRVRPPRSSAVGVRALVSCAGACRHGHLVHRLPVGLRLEASNPSTASWSEPSAYHSLLAADHELDWEEHALKVGIDSRVIFGFRLASQDGAPSAVGK